jgi:hypothetical protein
MDVKKEAISKFISINLFHKFKAFKNRKYRNFLSKKNLFYLPKKFRFIFKIIELNFYKINILLMNNHLKKILESKLYYNFFRNFDKYLECMVIQLYIIKQNFVKDKFFIKKKNLSAIYRFFKHQKKKKSQQYNFTLKIAHNINFLTENPTISKNLKFIKERIKNNRKNFRKYEILSCDPSSSLNFEDCIHFKFNQKCSKFELGIHVSDIASFLHIEKQNIIKSIEKVASCFSNNKKRDLFSNLLSYNLYSFRQGIDRFSFSLIFNLDHSSNILSLFICKSIIRNKRSFSKLQVNKIISQYCKKTDKNNKNCLFGKNLRKILEIKKKLNSNRIKINGKFQSKFGKILKKLNFFNTKKENDMTEEFMLLFNISLTEKILEYFPSCSNIQIFSKNSKTIKSIFFNIILFPKIKINFKNFKFFYKCAKIFLWKERNLVKNTFSIETIFNNYRIIDFFNFINKIFIKKFMIHTISFLYLQFTSPVRRIFDVFSHFFIFYIFSNFFNMGLVKWTESLNFMYFYEKFYLLLIVISKKSN